MKSNLFVLVLLFASITSAWADHTHVVKDEAQMAMLNLGTVLKFHEPLNYPGKLVSGLEGNCSITIPSARWTRTIGEDGPAGEYRLTAMTFPLELVDSRERGDCTRIAPMGVLGGSPSCIIGTPPAGARIGVRVNLYFQSLTGSPLTLSCPVADETVGGFRSSFDNNPYFLQAE